MTQQTLANNIANILTQAALRRLSLGSPANAGDQLDFLKKNLITAVGIMNRQWDITMEHNKQVIQQVLALSDQTIHELRELWQALFNTKAPPYSKTYLIPRLAYRLQELAYGGLSDDANKQLEKLTNDMAEGRKTSSRFFVNKPPTGTKLVREFQGATHEVIVTENDYIYQGQPYKSLSVIARKITGTRWSGPEFFGLKNKKRVNHE